MNIQEIKNNENVKQSIRNYSRLGVDITINTIDEDGLQVEVAQNRLINGIILNKKELTERVKEVFSNFYGVKKLVVTAKVWSFKEDSVSVEWMEKEMEKYGLTRADIVEQCCITKANLSLYLSGKRDISKGIKARLFYYFMTFELSRALRGIEL